MFNFGLLECSDSHFPETKLKLNTKEEDASVCLLFDLAGIKYDIEEVCVSTSQLSSKLALTSYPAG